VTSLSNGGSHRVDGAKPAVHAEGPLGGLADDLTPADLAAEWEEEKPPAAGPLANVASALVVAAVGTGAIIGAVKMGLGTPADPQPGMWPLLIGIVLVALAAALALFGRNTLDAQKFSRSSLQVIAGLATLIGFAALIGTIGFELPALVLTLIWLRFLGKETWRMSVLLSVVITVCFYLLFVLALNVPIPHLF
jgi:hypothetical protein